jgi:transcriptional regulator with XRE-family HTH domain
MLDPRLQKLADAIKAAIEDSSYSPAEVARALKVDKSAVSRWMSGGRTPTVQNLIDLAALLGLEARDFWEGEQAIPATPEQRSMLDKMGNMTPEQQQAFLALAATLFTQK